MFLLYLGPIVLKTLLPTALYENFLLLHAAVTILCSNELIHKLGTPLAKELLRMFINHSKTVYGSKFLIYNVHMMSHITDDVELFGALDTFSAFPFENYLQHIKQLVRSPNKPLAQIVKRLKEIQTQKSLISSS